MNQLLDSQEETNYNLSSIESGIQMLVEANEQKEKENLQLKKTRFVRNFIRNDFKSREEVLQAAQKASIEIETPCTWPSCWESAATAMKAVPMR